MVNFPANFQLYLNLFPGKDLRLLFVLATEHTLLRIFLNIWRQILFPGDLHDTVLQNFCTAEYGTFNYPYGRQTHSMLEQLPVSFYLITGRIQLDCFDRPVYSQCALCYKTWLKFRK